MASDGARLLNVWQVDLRSVRLYAHTALRIALARELDREPEELELVLGAQGRPELAGREVSFSSSTRGDVCVIEVSQNGAVGGDVEHVVPRAGLDRLLR